MVWLRGLFFVCEIVFCVHWVLFSVVLLSGGCVNGVQFYCMPDDSKVSRSIEDEMVDGLKNSIVTPAETFFFALFVFGVLSLAATTLVGTCGNVDDFEKEVSERSLDPIVGATAVLTQSVVFDDTIVGSGTCVIIERFGDEEDEEEAGDVHVHVLAKAQPFFTGELEAYRPLAPFENFFRAPISTMLFLHEGTPKGEVTLQQISVVETQTYTSWFRDFYLNTIYIVMAVLGVLLIFLVYIGAKFEKRRKVWYRRHTLRARYISRLMQDKARMRELQGNWEKVAGVVHGENSEKWKESLALLQETLDGVLVLLRFEGENLMEKLQNMTEDDLWNIEKLWEANSLILRTLKQVEEDESVPAITEKVMQKVVAIHLTSFVWLGLLPHHLDAPSWVP